MGKKSQNKIKILGVIPARSGSKGIKNKNLRKINGTSLIGIVAKTLVQSGLTSRNIISTDSSSYANEAAKFGIEVPFLRPEELANDTAKTVDVLAHAVNYYLKNGESFTHVLTLQPSSPTVTSEDLKCAVSLLEKNQVDGVISAFRPYKKDSVISFLADGCAVKNWAFGEQTAFQNRQNIPPIFVRTGLFYLSPVQEILKGNMVSPETGFVEIEESRAFCIDDEKDLELVRKFYE